MPSHQVPLSSEPRSLAAQLQSLHSEERDRRMTAELTVRRLADRLSLAGVTEDEINALLEEASR
jgi:hypothetical protein